MAKTIKKRLGEGQFGLDKFSDPTDNLREILIAMSKKMDEMITIINTHTHSGGAAPTQQVVASDVKIES